MVKIAYGFRLLYKTMRFLLRVLLWTTAVVGVLAIVSCILFLRFVASQQAAPDVARRVREAAQDGRLAYRLTEPNELTRLLGPPVAEVYSSDGDMRRVQLAWPGVHATFMGIRDRRAAITLRWLKLGGVDVAVGPFRDSLGGFPVDIGSARTVKLRNTEDLGRFDDFFGFQGVSLAAVDLRTCRDLLLSKPFDNLTGWPDRDRMPDGFDPNLLLEQGKNPGLELRQLHAEGIDGRGVSIAIIDQPLVKDHVEYANQLVLYKEIGLVSRLASPQMHGPAVACIAVGESCGVAPRASLYHFALVSLAMPENRDYCRMVDEILQMNRRLPQPERIRVISISYGMFSRRPHRDEWNNALERARQQGVLVVTCDPAFMSYGTLARVPGADPDDPNNYRRGRYGPSTAGLLVPAGHRTIASERGATVYKYDPVGGMSWAAPYLAGLAALAFQLDPGIDPDAIIELLVSTATETPVGPIVNPRGFLETVKARAHDAAL